jgi:integrase
MESVLYDAGGHRRSPVTVPGSHQGRPPRNMGLRHPADPPAAEEIVAVMRAAGGGADGARLRALIVLLWRAGLRIREALELAETDLDAARRAVIVGEGRDGRRREVETKRWGVASAPVLARDPISASRRRVPLHDPRSDRWTTGPVGRAQAAAHAPS